VVKFANSLAMPGLSVPGWRKRFRLLGLSARSGWPLRNTPGRFRAATVRERLAHARSIRPWPEALLLRDRPCVAAANRSIERREIIGGLSANCRVYSGPLLLRDRRWWGRRFRLPGQAEGLPHQRRSRSSNTPQCRFRAATVRVPHGPAGHPDSWRRGGACGAGRARGARWAPWLRLRQAGRGRPAQTTGSAPPRRVFRRAVSPRTINTAVARRRC
jgi:hypothetical protein